MPPGNTLTLQQGQTVPGRPVRGGHVTLNEARSQPANLPTWTKWPTTMLSREAMPQAASPQNMIFPGHAPSLWPTRLLRIGQIWCSVTPPPPAASARDPAVPDRRRCQPSCPVRANLRAQARRNRQVATVRGAKLGAQSQKTSPANCSPSAVSMISPSRPVLGSVMRVTVSSSQIWPGWAMCECRGHLDELLRGLLSRSQERQG